MGVMDKVCIDKCCFCLLQQDPFYHDSICSTLLVAGIVASADGVLDVADQAENARIRQYW